MTFSQCLERSTRVCRWPKSREIATANQICGKYHQELIMNLKMKQNTLNEGKGNKLGSELWLAREGKATTIPHNPHSVHNVSMMLAI